MVKISLLEAPICAGSPTLGSDQAFRSLTEHGIRAAVNGEITLVPMEHPEMKKADDDPRLHALDEVMAVSEKLYENVKTVLSEGGFPVVIGGDHSVAMGSIAGVSSVYGPDELSVVYIDGHTDINTEKTSLTGYIHGMPLAAAMGLCTDRLTVGNKVNLYGKNTYIIGARSIDPGEYPIVEEQGVHLYTADEIRKRGIADVVGEVLSSIRTKAIHVSFDVDSLDETEFPSTGYRMPDGMMLDEVETVLETLFATGRVVSLDCVEYNPTLDESGEDRVKLFEIFSRCQDMLALDGEEKE